MTDVLVPANIVKAPFTAGDQRKDVRRFVIIICSIANHSVRRTSVEHHEYLVDDELVN